MQKSSETREKNIQRAIALAEHALKSKYPMLQYQNAIGLAFLISAMTLFCLTAVAYGYGLISAWVCALLNAFWGAIIHEVEHDVFHGQYFKPFPVIQHTILLCCWIFRPNMPNPWIRRTIHLQHHKHSGTADDIEEQIIGNGLPYGIKRILMCLDPFFTLLRFSELKRYTAKFQPVRMLLSLFPMYIIYTTIWVIALQSYLIGTMNVAFGTTIPLLITTPWLINVANFLMIAYVLPSLVRYFALIFITTAIHYQGGVNRITEQAQVLTHWIFWPLQIFCINFGGTHQIHHLYVPQPFYIRMLIRHKVYPVMRENGVKFNNFGTFLQANHFPSA